MGLFLLGIMLVEPPAVFAKDFRSAYNEGVAKAGQGDKKAAEDLFQEVSEHAADNVLRQRALSNLGVLKVESGDLEGAKKSFDSALAMDPQDQQTRENLQWTQKQLKNKQESKKDDQKKDDQKKDDQKKDDQKKDDQKKDDQKKDDQKKDDQKKD
ncbi:MAG: tetratricopeptide repeat protein, partial [Proteobacteria bacterium]|nr:tetratricopeptide repeat protein [Pseudomonadota bacterium]